jgi:hypothetical protein
MPCTTAKTQQRHKIFAKIILRNIYDLVKGRSLADEI